MNKQRKTAGYLLISLGMMLCTAASADPDSRALAEGCFSCHGVEGRGGGISPALAGRPESELAARMLDLRDPKPGVTIMPRLLRTYTESEIAALARWFAAVTP